MNTTEHLVEVYYRQQGCFTATDIKVERGNNRQLDLLAFNYMTKIFYHIEVSVAHGEHWAASLNDIREKIRFKYFGEPYNKRPDNPNTDFAKGKKYLEPIKETYTKFGIDYNLIKRVWCVWCLNDTTDQDIENWKQSLASEFGLRASNFEILSFRDEVLPRLLENIGTAYYDDELLRTLSLIKEYNKQKAQE